MITESRPKIQPTRAIDPFDRQYSRIKSCLGLNTDVDLALTLGVSPQSVAAVKKRGKIPTSWYNELFSRGISIDYILSGRQTEGFENLDLEKDEILENITAKYLLGKTLQELDISLSNDEQKIFEVVIQSKLFPIVYKDLADMIRKTKKDR